MNSKCGTLAGYSAHRHRKEPTCDLCKQAKTEYQRRKISSYPACRLDNCDRPAVALGLCSPHRQKEVRNGDPEIDARNPERNFWSRVTTGPLPDYAPELGACWLWTGKTTQAGYGTFRVTQNYVHRYAFEYMRAPIPDSLTIDHLCRVRNCVNPYHLEPVPLAENSRRAKEARKKELAS
jgi:hypothetical protein